MVIRLLRLHPLPALSAEAHLVEAIAHHGPEHCKDGHTRGPRVWQAPLYADGRESSRGRGVLQDWKVLHGLRVARQSVRRVSARKGRPGQLVVCCVPGHSSSPFDH